MSSIYTPVIIVGCGPAGSAASIFLTKEGIHHVVLEKEFFPRDKICGDACSGKTTAVFRKANPAWIDEIMMKSEQFNSCDGIDFFAPNGKKLSVPFRLNKQQHNEIVGFTSPRLVFDNFMFEKASDSQYATIHQGVIINRIERLENQKIYVSCTINKRDYQFIADLIIAADGDKSMVAKSLHGAIPLKSDSVGIRAYYENVKDMSPDNFIELHFMKEFLPGYFWIFPLPNGRANVGLGMLSSHVRKHKLNLRTLMLEVIEQHPTLSKRFEEAQLVSKIAGWGLPMATVKRAISGDRYLLTGDAAGLIDPFSGEGIGNAMYSGMLAAWAAHKAILSQNFSATFLEHEYDQVVYRYFGDEFKISTAMQKMCNYPFLFNLVVNKSQKSASLRNTISGMFGDLEIRNQLRKPSFYWKVMINR